MNKNVRDVLLALGGMTLAGLLLHFSVRKGMKVMFSKWK